MNLMCEIENYIGCIVSAMYSFYHDMLIFMFGLTPNETFLAAIVAFETGIIAFLIPLSIEIVSKISERFSSEVIVEQFERHWVLRLIPIVLLFNIFLGGSLLFLQKYKSCDFMIVLTWLVFVLFIFSCWATYKIVKRMKTYITNTEQIINQLANEAEEIIE